MREPLGALGISLVLIMVFGAVFADLLASAEPSRISPRDRFQAPNLDHLMGTDQLGRDLFSRVLHGGRIALSVALFSTAVSLIIGTVLGLLAGYGPRWLDNLLILLFDSIKSFPTVMLALALVTLFGPSLTSVIIVVVLVNVPGYARIIRTQTLALKSAEFVPAPAPARFLPKIYQAPGLQQLANDERTARYRYDLAAYQPADAAVLPGHNCAPARPEAAGQETACR